MCRAVKKVLHKIGRPESWIRFPRYTCIHFDWVNAECSEAYWTAAWRGGLPMASSLVYNLFVVKWHLLTRHLLNISNDDGIGSSRLGLCFIRLYRLYRKFQLWCENMKFLARLWHNYLLGVCGDFFVATILFNTNLSFSSMLNNACQCQPAAISVWRYIYTFQMCQE